MGFIEDAASWVGNTASGFGDNMNDAFGLTNMFDPGKNERSKADDRDAAATKLWLQSLPQNVDGSPIISDRTAQEFSLDAPAIGMGADDIHRYGEGGAGYLPGSTAQWTDGGSSNFDNLSFDQSSLDSQKKAEDYFANLANGGTDAVAEAEYARREQQAEQARRAATEGALAQLETQGRGGSGASLLASLNAGRGQATDQYQAGLDANAIAQARRDNAQVQSANVASTRGNNVLAADQAKATGQDAWSQWEEGTKADLADKNANRDQDARVKNWERQNTVSDANVDLQNQRAWWQGPGKNDAMWDRQQQAIAGASGAYNQAAEGLRDSGAAQPAATDIVGRIIGGIAGGA